MAIPKEVREYVADIPHPSGLIGCRCGSLSLDCCEYDIAIIAEGKNSVVKLGKYTVETIYLKSFKEHLVDIKDIEIFKDSKTLLLSSTAKEITDAKYGRLLAAAGKKQLVASLFFQQKTKSAKQPMLAALWLKIAAYRHMAGTLAISGVRPMPLHELDQIRQQDLTSEVADGVNASLECIGVERATRSQIARSIEAFAEIKSNDYDRDLVLAKAEYLLDNGKLADSYYYMGRILADMVSSKSEQHLARYSKLYQIALDLGSVQNLERIQKVLFRATKKGLN
jgi:hypothetical protein